MRKILSACAILVAMSGIADAKSLSRILAETGLSSEDFDMMGQYAAGLYERGTPKAGSRAQWSNDSSGAAGTVTLDAVSGKCVSLRHALSLEKDVAAEFTIRPTTCSTIRAHR